jgi:hypothetical protein
MTGVESAANSIHSETLPVYTANEDKTDDHLNQNVAEKKSEI